MSYPHIHPLSPWPLRYRWGLISSPFWTLYWILAFCLLAQQLGKGGGGLLPLPLQDEEQLLGNGQRKQGGG